MRRYRHFYLLGSLVLLIVGYPFLGERFLGKTLVGLFLVLTLVASVVATASTRRQVVVAVALLVPTLLAQWLVPEGAPAAAVVLFPVLALLFLVHATVLLLRSIVFESAHVSADTLCGAISAYLFMGLIWSFAYALLEFFEPGSFALNGHAITDSRDFSRFIGFSFITLTTLGYGNFVPQTPRADSLCVAEALVGQIYLTVLVARLVALHISQPRESGRGDA